MTMQSFMLLAAFLVVLLALSYPLGILLARVGDGTAVPGMGWLGKLEKLLYRLAGVSPEQGMGWKSYAVALLLFNGIGALAVYGVQRVQAWFSAHGLQDLLTLRASRRVARRNHIEVWE